MTPSWFKELTLDESSDLCEEKSKEIASALVSRFIDDTQELGPKNVAVAQAAFMRGLAMALAIFVEMNLRICKEEKKKSWAPLVHKHVIKYYKESQGFVPSVVDGLEEIGKEMLDNMIKTEVKH